MAVISINIGIVLGGVHSRERSMRTAYGAARGQTESHASRRALGRGQAEERGAGGLIGSSMLEDAGNLDVSAWSVAVTMAGVIWDHNGVRR